MTNDNKSNVESLALRRAERDFPAMAADQALIVGERAVYIALCNVAKLKGTELIELIDAFAKPDEKILDEVFQEMSALLSTEEGWRKITDFVDVTDEYDAAAKAIKKIGDLSKVGGNIAVNKIMSDPAAGSVQMILADSAEDDVIYGERQCLSNAVQIIAKAFPDMTVPELAAEILKHDLRCEGNQSA